MNLPEYALKHQFAVWFVLLLLTVGGLYSYLTLGRLEDPEYTIKTGVVVTVYPGATAREVEQNVTDTIETAIYRLKQVDKVRSISRPGFSIIYVDLKPSTPTEDLDGCFTLPDEDLFCYLRMLDRTCGIRIEPSACAGFAG